jgi:hypothetical protein
MGIWIGGVGQEVILSVTSFYNYLRPTILGRFSKKNEQLLYLTLACETAALYVGPLFNRFRICFPPSAGSTALSEADAMQK